MVAAAMSFLSPPFVEYRAALRSAFPEREFVAEVDVDGSCGPELTFFQATQGRGAGRWS
jgi:hypothetical protein